MRVGARASTRAAIGSGGLILGLGLAGCATAGEETESTVTETPSVATTPDRTNDAPPSTVDTATYQDGEYSATGWYGGLPSHQDVTLTIDDDIVTAIEITTPAEDETSLGYQQRFADALPGVVVGRSLDDIAFDRLAGSSGCTEGFFDALADVREQASD